MINNIFNQSIICPLYAHINELFGAIANSGYSNIYIY